MVFSWCVARGCGATTTTATAVRVVLDSVVMAMMVVPLVAVVILLGGNQLRDGGPFSKAKATAAAGRER